MCRCMYTVPFLLLPIQAWNFPVSSNPWTWAWSTSTGDLLHPMTPPPLWTPQNWILVAAIQSSVGLFFKC
jgi:hypothetical protein